MTVLAMWIMIASFGAGFKALRLMAEALEPKPVKSCWWKFW